MHRLRSFLQNPLLYLLLQRITGAMRARKICIQNYARYQNGERVLDVGCGPGYVIDYMPEVDYIGTDVDESYVAFARKKYGRIGEFHLMEIHAETIAELGTFDLILLNGVLHHLNDHVAEELLFALSQGLRKNGRLVTLDGCYYPDTSMISKSILNQDRGEHVRTQVGYQKLVESVFDDVEMNRRRDLFWIPYDALVMVCRGA